MPDLDRLELEEVGEQLGPVKEEFHPHRGNLLAARIIGPIVASIGVAIIGLTLSSGNLADDKFRIILACGALAVFSGLASLLWSWHRSFYRLLLCERGLVEVTRGKVRAWKWEEIEKVENREKALDLTSQRKTWLIRFRSGKSLNFDIQSVAEVERCMALVKAETDKRQIPWHTNSK